MASRSDDARSAHSVRSGFVLRSSRRALLGCLIVRLRAATLETRSPSARASSISIASRSFGHRSRPLECERELSLVSQRPQVCRNLPHPDNQLCRVTFEERLESQCHHAITDRNRLGVIYRCRGDSRASLTTTRGRCDPLTHSENWRSPRVRARIGTVGLPVHSSHDLDHAARRIELIGLITKPQA